MDGKKTAALTGVMYYLQAEADEREQETLRQGSKHRRSGWTSHGRSAAARNCQMVQGRRFSGQRPATSPGSRKGYRPGQQRPCAPERPDAIPVTAGMQVK